MNDLSHLRESKLGHAASDDLGLGFVRVTGSLCVGAATTAQCREAMERLATHVGASDAMAAMEQRVGSIFASGTADSYRRMLDFVSTEGNIVAAINGVSWALNPAKVAANRNVLNSSRSNEIGILLLLLVVVQVLLSSTQRALTELLRSVVCRKVEWIWATRHPHRYCLKRWVSRAYPSFSSTTLLDVRRWLSWKYWRLWVNDSMALAGRNVTWCRAQERCLTRLMGAVHRATQELYHGTEKALSEAESAGLIEDDGNGTSPPVTDGAANASEDEAATKIIAALLDICAEVSKIAKGVFEDIDDLPHAPSFIALDATLIEDGERSPNKSAEMQSSGKFVHESSAASQSIGAEEQLGIQRLVTIVEAVKSLQSGVMHSIRKGLAATEPPKTLGRLMVLSTLAFGCAAVYVARDTGRIQRTSEWASNVVQWCWGMMKERIYTPAAGLISGLVFQMYPQSFSDSLQREQETLADMIVEYHRRAEPLACTPESLAAVRVDALNGKQSNLVKDHWVQASLNPLWSFRSLLMLLMIKIQSSKVEFDELHRDAMDVMYQNSLSFKMAALLPVAGAALLWWKWFMWRRGAWRKRWTLELRRGYRGLHRVFARSETLENVTRTDPGRALQPSRANQWGMTDDMFGKILIHVCEMRAVVHALNLSQEEIDGFDADLDDIEDIRFTATERLRVLQRMGVTHFSVLSFDCSYQ